MSRAPILGPQVPELTRQAVGLRNSRAGQLTAREMGDQAGRVLDAAHRAQRIAAKRRGGRREDAARRRAAEALLTAAVQIRLAAATRDLERRPLHALTVQQVQAAEADVRRIIADDTREQWGALAVDTHRRVQEHRARCRQENR
jgi:hypothetical protein